MESKDTTVLEYFFKGDYDFTVPYYQRNYEWDKNKCELLFTDAVNSICTDSVNVTKHFLGFFILVPTGKNPNSNKPASFYTIDGQQRLVTIYLFLKALYDLCTEEDLQNEIRTYLYNDLDSCSTAANKNVKLILKNVVNASEKDDFETIIISPHGEVKIVKHGKPPKSHTYNNYKYFISEIKKLAKSRNNSNVDIVIKELFQSLCNFSCCEIQLDKTDDAQLVYDRINSSGKPLSLADKVRNYLLMEDSDEGLYDLYWKKMEDDLLGVNPVFKNDIVSKYLEYYVMFREPRRLLRNGDSYYAFKVITTEVFEGDKTRVLQDLKHYSDYYSFFVKKIDSKANDAFGNYTYKIKHLVDSFAQLEILTVYPVLFALFEDFNNHIINSTYLEKSLDFLLNYLVRRMLHSVASNSLSDAFKGMCDNIIKIPNLDKPKNKNYLNVFVYQYIASLYKNHMYIKDDLATKEIISKLNMYTFKRGDLCRFLLCHLEFLNNEKEIPSIENVTIEHIMPKNKNAAWRNEIGEKDYDRVHGEWLDRLGNLSFSAYNFNMHDEPFKNKKEDAFNNSGFAYLNGYVRNQSCWKEKQIKERNEILTSEVMKWLKLPDEFVSAIQTATKTRLKLSEIDSFTHRKPTSYEINKETFNLDKSTTACLTESVSSYLYNLSAYHDVIVGMAHNNESLDGTTRVPFLIKGSANINNNSKLRRINKNDSGVEPIYVDTHQDNDKALAFLKRLFGDHRFNISEDDLIINFE